VSPKRGVAPLRRDAIVQATIRCLARDGYSGLRMKEVARVAGVSQGILHYYFDSKRAILLAALEKELDDLDRRVAPALRAAPDARAQVRAAIGAFLALADENREFWLVFVEFWGEMMHDRELSQVNAALYRRLRRTLGAVVARGTRGGLFRKVEPEGAGSVVLALVDGISLQRAFDPKAMTLARAVRLCEDAALGYLEKR
jgi:AcrR family transcriptional regulator